MLWLTPLYSTTRGSKVKTLTETIKRPGLEFVQVDDLIYGDLTEALKGKKAFLARVDVITEHVALGVSAIIHVASPLPGRTTVQHTLDVRTCELFTCVTSSHIMNRVRKKELFTFYVRPSRLGSRKS